MMDKKDLSKSSIIAYKFIVEAYLGKIPKNKVEELKFKIAGDISSKLETNYKFVHIRNTMLGLTGLSLAYMLNLGLNPMKFSNINIKIYEDRLLVFDRGVWKTLPVDNKINEESILLFNKTSSVYELADKVSYVISMCLHFIVKFTYLAILVLVAIYVYDKIGDSFLSVIGK